MASEEIIENSDNITKKEKSKQESKKILKQNIRNLLIKIIFIIIACYILLGIVFGIKRMNTSFMKPKITEGDLLIFYRMNKEYDIEDVVVFEKNNKQYVSRIIAKEGQTVDVSEEGELLINGYPEQEESYYEMEKPEDMEITFPYTVKPGTYFVLNDYRTNSEDSRKFGAVGKDELKGKIIGRIQIRNI